MISTIFQNSTQDIDACIALYSDPCSRLALSGVNKTAYFILSNEFFKRCFKKEHPFIQEDDYKNSLDLLCTCHPKNCWKIASCYFAMRAADTYYSFNFSRSFLREAFSDFQALVKLRKESKELELKEICGSCDADPDSPIDQVWKSWEASKKALEESQKALSIFEVDSCGNKNLAIIEVLDAMKSRYTSEEEFAVFLSLMQMFSGSVFSERLALADRSSIEKLRSDEVFKINIDSFEELRELIIDRLFLGHDSLSIKVTETKELKIDEDYFRSLISESLFNEYLTLFKFMFDKNLQFCINYTEESELRKQYDALDRERIWIEKYLTQINKCFDKLNLINSGSTCSSCDYIYIEYDINLRCSLRDVSMQEVWSNNIKALDQCIIALNKANEHPENLTLLDPVRNFINQCSKNVKTEIWRTLYEHCANGVIEDRWSENHYGEFLSELKEIVQTSIDWNRNLCGGFSSSASEFVGELIGRSH